MLGIPAPTPYDLRFQVLGFPTRVHPLFWLVTALLGGLGQHGRSPLDVLIWIACVLASILVHELGHAAVARSFGAWPAIVLTSMGGLCYYDRDLPPGQRIAVLAWGPGAGFVFCALVLAVGGVAFGLTPADSLALLGLQLGLNLGDVRALLKVFSAGEIASQIFFDLIFINFLWGLVNLLPIWPLDGGQMTGEILKLVGARQPMHRTHIVSMLVAGLLAVFVYNRSRDLFLTLFFAYFAFINYQMLQAIHDRSTSRGDDDWWRR